MGCGASVQHASEKPGAASTGFSLFARRGKARLEAAPARRARPGAAHAPAAADVPAAAPAPNGNVWAAKAALREKEREVERTTEKDEAEVEKAKDEAAKADEALKEKEAGIDPDRKSVV